MRTLLGLSQTTLNQDILMMFYIRIDWSEVQVEIVFSKIKCIILTHQKDIEEEVKPWYDTPIYFVAVK